MRFTPSSNFCSCGLHGLLLLALCTRAAAAAAAGASAAAVGEAGGGQGATCQAAGATGGCRGPAQESTTAQGLVMIQMAKPTVTHGALEKDDILGRELVQQPPAAESLAQRVAASGSDSIKVVTYNLYWWNVERNNRFDALHGRIRDEMTFHLIGFQECDDVAQIVRSSGMSGFEYYRSACPLAWNGAVFKKLEEPSSKKIASPSSADQWSRYMSWVRLQHRATGATVMFVNTHGPLGNCGSTVGRNWASGINDNKRSGDIVVMVGDFNCGEGTSAMNIVKGVLPQALHAGIDHILTNGPVLSGGREDGWPSDHPLVAARFSLPSAGPATDGGNHYRKVSGVGAWGGWCTCPDGQRYNVGDQMDSCANGPLSLACEGGTPGECNQVVDSARDGMKVTCAAGAPSPPPEAASGTASCAAFAEWPSVDGGVTCSGCKALVLAAPYGGRCDKYCESFGHVCAAAAEEVNEDCQVSYSTQCDQEISGTSDILCTCHLPSSTSPAPSSTSPVPNDPSPTPAPSSEAASCAAFAEWPAVDGGVTCDGCQALVLTGPYGGRCDTYCESFGHVCVAAAEEANENCQVKYAAQCNQEISGTSDMLCTCHSPP